jgi:hypothetical protein
MRYPVPVIRPRPEFCPNSLCPYHDRQRAAGCTWYGPFGRFYTKARGWIRRFRCHHCGKTCSTQTFSIHYWTHSTLDLVRLLQEFYGCGGLRQMGRFRGRSYRVVQNRIRRLARNALAVMDAALDELELNEDLVMDGLESYMRSQFHPNNITCLVGADSQFTYGAVHTTLRRSGAMTPAQRRTREHIDVVWRPPRSVEADCSALLADLAPAIAARAEREPVILASDEHGAYPRAIKAVTALASLLAEGRLVHQRTSSRRPRTRANPLFAANYLDRQLRKNCAEHVRETVRQGREINCQMERMAVFMALHNFLTPHRITDRAYVGDGPRHASKAGVRTKAVVWHLRRFVTHRHVWSHCRSKAEWMRRIWKHAYENPPAVRAEGETLFVREVALGPGRLPRHLRV